LLHQIKHKLYPFNTVVKEISDNFPPLAAEGDRLIKVFPHYPLVFQTEENPHYCTPLAAIETL